MYVPKGGDHHVTSSGPHICREPIEFADDVINVATALKKELQAENLIILGWQELKGFSRPRQYEPVPSNG